VGGFAGLSAPAREGALKVERLFQISPSNEAMATLLEATVDEDAVFALLCDNFN
jgi:hypothetical protein